VRRVFTAASSPTYDFDSYGNPSQATTQLTDFGFAGMVANADSGIDLTTHRAYDPVSGRFLTRDSIGEAGDPQGNLYAYVGGNPVGLMDPSGLLCSDMGPHPRLLAIAGGLLLAAAGGLLIPETGGLSLALEPEAEALLAAGVTDLGLEGAEGAASAGLAAEAVGGAGVTGESSLTSVFWSGEGSEAAANAWIAENGGQTLAMSEYAVGAEPAAGAIEEASATFANNASGIVQVFNGPTVLIDSTWAQVEYPALMSNPNVTGFAYQVLGEDGQVVETIFVSK
jgi:RHS repeat-associated protein